MSNARDIEGWLAQGGRLTAPDNVPPRYRGELLRLMATFVDSQLAGSAGFAATINDAPGIAERIAASRIVLEKADHAGRVLALMEPFGTDVRRYQARHGWADRLPREADLGLTRAGHDLRLSVFHYPLQGWADAVTMNALMGLASTLQIGEFARASYTPLAETLAGLLPREIRHAELGWEGLARLVGPDGERAAVAASLAYWHPRVAASFGAPRSARHERLAGFGLRHARNEDLLAAWQSEVARRLAALGLPMPQGDRP